MSETRIPPALSAEEWATFPNWPESHARDQADAPLYFPTKHGIAAANLHREPFGFTQEDVKFLAEEAWLLLEEGAINARRRRLNEIASRIAALLPPPSSPETP